MLLWWAFNPLFITHHNSASYHATWAKAHATRAGEHGPGNTGQGKKVFEMWQQCVFIQIRIILSAQMYMYGKKNKNKKKNYYRNNVILSLWSRSVGIYDFRVDTLS